MASIGHSISKYPTGFSATPPDPLSPAVTALAAALRHAGKGVLALGLDRALLYADELARSLLEPAGPLRLRDGRLGASGVDGQRLRQSLERLERSGEAQFLLLRRRAAGREDAAGPSFAVTALRAGAAPFDVCHVLILEPLESAAALGEHALAQWFGLTPAQARVAACLSRGLTPEQVAAHCGRSIATVRTQIRAILERSGSNGLQQLHRQLASLGRGSTR